MPRRAGGTNNISIHALREEGDLCGIIIHNRRNLFLSTPSARRATIAQAVDVDRLVDFYPRPPRGGRPVHVLGQHLVGAISIHALREEGD